MAKIFYYNNNKTDLNEDTKCIKFVFGITNYEQRLFNEDMDKYIEKIMQDFKQINSDIYFGIFCGKNNLDFLSLNLSINERATIEVLLEKDKDIKIVENLIEFIKYYFGFEIKTIH